MQVEELKRLIIQRKNLKKELEKMLEPFKGLETGAANPMALMGIVPKVPAAFDLVKKIDEISDAIVGFVVIQIQEMESLPSE